MGGRAIGVLLVLAAATPAAAEMPARVTVAGEGDCPAPAALARALGRLHPTLRVDVHAADGVHVDVRDHGARYEVRVGDATRTLDDPGRRCGERATAAALAATLLIAPPTAPPSDEPAGPLAPRESPPPKAPASSAGHAPPPAERAPSPTERAPRSKQGASSQADGASSQADGASSPTDGASSPTDGAPSSARPTSSAAERVPLPTRPAPPLATPPPALAAPAGGSNSPIAARADAAPTTVARTATTTRPRRPARVDLELVGLVDGAPALGSAAAEFSGGASLRLAIGGRHVAATVGLAGLAPATATSANIAVDVVRIPFDAGVRLALPVGRVDPALDVGVAFAVLQLSAPSLTAATTSTRLDVGARLAPSLRVALTPRWALVATLQMVVSFAPYDLAVDTTTMKIGTTPRLWLGGGLGLVARL